MQIIFINDKIKTAANLVGIKEKIFYQPLNNKSNLQKIKLLN